MQKKESKFTRIDGIIVLLCIIGATFSGAAFWREYTNTLVNLNEEPVGTITFQRRVAQRRFVDRHMWDRLQLASPVFNGDTIRTIEQSKAIIVFQDEVTYLSLSENTMIQIFFDNRAEVAYIDFLGGNLDVVSETASLVITSGSSTIVVEGQAAIERSEEGFVLAVSEGHASFDGVEIKAGNILALDPYGEINTSPVITMTSFGSYVSFMSPPGQTVPVVFSWNSFFFTPDTNVIVEVSENRRFTRIVETIYIDSGDVALDGGAVKIALGQGNYWWRVFPVDAGTSKPSNRLFPSGTMEIIPAAAPHLLSPPHAAELLAPPHETRIPLSWSAVEGASAYKVEISARADMENPIVSRRVDGSSVMQTSLDYGLWHWRVTPVFPPQIRGIATPSAVGEFSLIRGGQVLAAPLPAPASGGRLMWRHDPNAAYWLVEVADNPAMANPALRRNFSSNFVVLPPEFQQAGQSWYWRVTALGGAEPAVSPVQTFVVPEPEQLAAVEPVLAPPEPEVAALVPAPVPPPIIVPLRPPIPQFPALIFSPNLGNWDALSAELAASNQQTLVLVVSFMEENSEFRLRIEGHANPTINPANVAGHRREQLEGTLPLSELRARVVADRLVQLGVDPGRLEPRGLGGERTIAAWEDTANWWQNRRVEFVVVE